MNQISPEKCPYCNSNNIGVGYQLGNGQMFADLYAYQSTGDCSNIEHLLCKDCGSILRSRVVRTGMFHQYSSARQAELGDYLEENGILLCNESKELPSLCGLGYSMENIIGLIELRQVFYCKAFRKRSTYLSVKAYQLLNRIKEGKELYPEARSIYEEIRKHPVADKEEVRVSLNLEKKTFDKAFDFLLENLYITACSGKRMSANWYSYLYCTADHWKKEVNGLHYNGNPKEALWKLVGGHMTEKDFEVLCK